MLAAPRGAALPILADDDAEPHAGATIAVLARYAQAQHAIAQFVADDRDRWRRSDYGGPAIFRRNDDPRAVGALLIATPLIVAVATWPRLALRGNRGAGRPADDRTDRSALPAAYCSAQDCPGRPAEDCAAHRVLRGRVLNRRGNGDGK